MPAVALFALFNSAKRDEFNLFRDMRAGRFKRKQRHPLLSLLSPFVQVEDRTREASFKLLQKGSDAAQKMRNSLSVKGTLSPKDADDITEEAESHTLDTQSLTSISRNSTRSLNDGRIKQSSPWVNLKKEMKMLDSILPGYKKKAKHSTEVTMFDLVAWAVAQGAFALAEQLLRRTQSPLRASLLVHDMCRRLSERVGRVHSNDVKDVKDMQDKCLHLATGVLDMISEEDHVLRAVLDSESSEKQYAYLCGRSKSISVMSIAIELRNKRFVAHRNCKRLSLIHI